MKAPKTEQIEGDPNWIDKVRQIFSVSKAEIDRREVEYKKQRAKRKRKR